MRNRLFWVMILAGFLAIATRDFRGQRAEILAAFSTGPAFGVLPLAGKGPAMGREMRVRQDGPAFQTNPHLSAGNLQAGSAQANFSPGATGKPDPSQRLREGREVRDLQATFQVVGERMSCRIPSVNATVTVLENLALERVYEMLTRYEDTTSWEIEGTITENHGRNYLLLRRAVVNSVLLDER
jgi:hypothetical protein